MRGMVWVRRARQEHTSRNVGRVWPATRESHANSFLVCGEQNGNGEDQDCAQNPGHGHPFRRAIHSTVLQPGVASLAAPPSPPCGWRIVISPAAGHVTLSHSVAGLRGLNWWSLISKVFAPDNIFGSDGNDPDTLSSVRAAVFSGGSRYDSNRIHFSVFVQTWTTYP
jgi:hypothetical protein